MSRPNLKVREGRVQIEGNGVEGEYRIRPMPGPVVYLLMRGDKVVYVGQSSNVYQRLWWHGQDGKDFDGWVRIDVVEGDPLEVERELIRAIDPEYNDMCSATTRHSTSEHVQHLRAQHEKLPIR